jgi:deferrochelatase/peroxidase EfeB
MGSPALRGNVTPFDYSDVQGLAAYGYSKLIQARYFLMRIRDAAAARAWIASAPVSTAEPKQSAPDTALQLAFTPAGLHALGVPENAIAGFSPEFLKGMAGEASRSRRLGDIGKSDPAGWLWGGPGKSPDLVVMLFAKQNLEAWMRAVQRDPWHAAFETVAPLATSDMGGHEPFGFVDGISQPEFDWKRERIAEGTTLAYENVVALGELLLGYPNEYGKYTDRPLVAPEEDAANELLPAEDQPARKDLGRNGMYLVLRTLEQDVRGFWQYLDKAAAGPQERYSLGAAMVGRTLDGAPLIPLAARAIAGISEKPGEPRNAFTYDNDPRGTQCPFGAHIRRANPRNADLFGNPSGAIAGLASRLGIPRPGFHEDLIASTRFHRVLRRGREYGDKITPEEALQPAPASEAPRGLQFACLCANIGRQFEFVQNAWLMSTKFNGLTGESDPLLGNRAAVGDDPVTGSFSIPREGMMARRLRGVPQFITVRGGAYFFMPGLRALRYIARLGNRGSAR